jgi:hypothetical protein
MMVHGNQRTGTAEAINSDRRPGLADTGIPESWSRSGDTDQAASCEQLGAITQFYRQSAPEQAVLSAAVGLAIVARTALGHVRDSYLTPWSAGHVRHKLMAVSVLSAMAEDQQLTDAALDIAINWARRRGQERAVTAAIAFGGPLGQRHLAEALRWLWALAARDERTAQVASLAFGQLFAFEAGLNSDKSAVATFLVRKVRPLLKPEAAAHDRRTALAVVDVTLSAAQGNYSTPAVASLIRTSQANLRLVAELWAAALNSVPHRRMAVIALHLTLAALTDDAESAELAVSLGRAMLPRLTARTSEVLELTLPDPQRTEAISGRLIAAFLAAEHEAVGA